MNKSYNFSFIDECEKNEEYPSVLSVREIKNYLKFFKYIGNSDLVHIHLGNWILRIGFIIICSIKKKNIVVTLHGQNTLEDLNVFSKKLTFFALKKASHIICVNKKIKDYLPMKLINKTYVNEAFIPPSLNKEPPLPDSLERVIHKYKNEKTLVCANAYRLIEIDNRQLYGLDQCIELAIQAKINKLNIHLFYVISYIPDDDISLNEYFNNIIKKEDLSEYLTLIPYTVSFVRLIEQCDVVLRPTLTDGDALTVREALYLNKVVIASNVIERPKGVFLYDLTDKNSLYLKIRKVLTSKDKVILNNSDKNYFNFYSKIYMECVE